MEGVQMSDTPISDSTPHNVADLGMLCRRLERELTASNAIIRQQQLLDEENLRLQDRIKWLEEEFNELRSNESRLLNSNEELERRIKRLEEWKESALEVEREWDANAIATLLGAKLGESQRKVIQREVPLLLERIKRLEKSSQQLKSLNNKICEINLKVSQERHDSNVRIKQLEQENDALRADLLLWDKAGIGFTTEDKP
jgi:DNA repair exonuclease SbcCD ATPase subunit